MLRALRSTGLDGEIFNLEARVRVPEGACLIRPVYEHMFVGRRRRNSELKSPKPLVRQKGRPPDPNRRRPTELRRCRRHGIVEFAQYSRGKTGFQWVCKRCVGEAVTRRKQKLKRILVEEAGGCCSVCGYDRCIINLHFHHDIPAEKSFPMTMAIGKSIATFREEAKKCVLVCANCHGEIEAGQIQSPPIGATFAGYGAVRKQLRRVA